MGSGESLTSKVLSEYCIAGTGVNDNKFLVARVPISTIFDKIDILSKLSKEEQSEYIKTGKLPDKHVNMLIIEGPEEEISEEDYKASIKRLNPGV